MAALCQLKCMHSAGPVKVTLYMPHGNPHTGHHKKAIKRTVIALYVLVVETWRQSGVHPFSTMEG